MPHKPREREKPKINNTKSTEYIEIVKTQNLHALTHSHILYSNCGSMDGTNARTELLTEIKRHTNE